MAGSMYQQQPKSGGLFDTAVMAGATYYGLQQ